MDYMGSPSVATGLHGWQEAIYAGGRDWGGGQMLGALIGALDPLLPPIEAEKTGLQARARAMGASPFPAYLHLSALYSPVCLRIM